MGAIHKALDSRPISFVAIQFGDFFWAKVGRLPAYQVRSLCAA